MAVERQTKQIPTDPNGSPWIGMDQIINVLRRRWLSILMSLCAGFGIGALYYATAQIKYESSAQILVMRKDPKLATSGVDASSQTEEGVSEDLLATHMQLLQSREIVGAALRESGLGDLPSITERLGTNETPTA